MFPALGREVEIKAPVVSKSAEEATPRAARMATVQRGPCPNRRAPPK
jgi:hypothetical protein